MRRSTSSAATAPAARWSSTPPRSTDADGTVTAAVCTFVDITDRAEARRRLDAAYAAERRARAAAEAAGERLGRLQQITAGLAEALTVEQVAAVIVRGGLSVAGCRSAWIGVLDDTGEALGVLAASFPVEPDGPAARIPLNAASPRAEVTRTGQPVWLPSAADALARYPGLRAIGIADGALGVVPLVSHGRPIGAMMLSFADEGAFDAAERALITTLAEQCAQALERARLHERAARRGAGPAAEHAAQRAARGGRAGARRPLPAGGASARGRRRLVRRGRAARRPGRARGRRRGRPRLAGRDHDGPAAQRAGRARAVDRVAGRVARRWSASPGRSRAPGWPRSCTACSTRSAGTLRYACAGHPPPLVAAPGGGTELLEEGRSPLLCALPPGAEPRRGRRGRTAWSRATGCCSTPTA